jgi:hypothetical protein
MNLKEIRDAMFAQADWAPTQSSEATSRVNSFINRAYNQLALEAPFLFFESRVHLATEPDVTSLEGNASAGLYDRCRLFNAVSGATPATTGLKDPWVWEVTYTVAQALVADNKLTQWKYDRSWDGRMIEITAADGTVLRNQIRSIWFAPFDDGTVGRYRFTLARPWSIKDFGDGHTDAAGTAINGFKYRIYTDAYALPDDLINLRSARLRDNTNNFPLDVLGQREAENFQLDGPPAEVTSGIPRVIFRRQHVHMRGPSVAPVAKAALKADIKPPKPAPVPDPSHPDNQDSPTLSFDPQLVSLTFDQKEKGTIVSATGDSDGVDVEWIGPEPAGTFEYKVTYTWGKRDVEFQLPGLGHYKGYAQPYDTIDVSSASKSFPSVSTSADGDGDPASRSRFREPRFESPPSRASNAMTNVRMGDKIAAIKLSLPNINYALGFMIHQTVDSVTRMSVPQSGVYIRVYRRRIDTFMAGYDKLGAATFGLETAKLDSDDAFHLLAEFNADQHNGGIWYDNGTFLPDYSRRLRDVHGYQTMQFYPKPDKRYAVEMRAVTRPSKLIDDQDVPLVHAEAINVLLEKAMVYLYENMGQTARSEYSEKRYGELLLTLSKRYGDLRPASTPVLRTMTRATGYRTNRRWNRRLSTDDLGGVVE